ncbi:MULTISPECIES: hypothetical protein [Flavobacterium]|uniref:DUF2262 domain-containing protein n=1 Tax=Flavobacterium jumunjinense TaxID=998845 RepID=A0ABV5GK70_9FLAO|nr:MULTISPECIES: hypothetical protein [Flavobacterium]
MKCRLKEESSQLFVKAEQYPIIAIRKTNIYDEIVINYLVCDDKCSLYYLGQNAIVITDDDKENYVDVSNPNCNEKIVIDKRFINLIYKSLNNTTSLEFRSEIWDITWLAKSLISIDFDITNRVEAFMNNEEYKVNLIEGFIEFATEYINFEKDSDAFFEIGFYKEEKTKSHLRFYTEDFKPIIDNSEKIKEFLFKGKEIINSEENMSDKISRKLYLMIDCIFIKESQSIFLYYDSYKSEKIIFEYDEYYYQLDLRESD